MQVPGGPVSQSSRPRKMGGRKDGPGRGYNNSIRQQGTCLKSVARMGGQRRQPQLFCLPERFAIQIQRCLLPSSVRASASPLRPTLGTTSSDGLSIGRVCHSLTSLSFPAPSALTFMNEDGRLCHRNRRHRLWENEMRVRSRAATELLSLLPSLRAH